VTTACYQEDFTRADDLLYVFVVIEDGTRRLVHVSSDRAPDRAVDLAAVSRATSIFAERNVVVDVAPNYEWSTGLCLSREIAQVARDVVGQLNRGAVSFRLATTPRQTSPSLRTRSASTIGRPHDRVASRE
jgi:hypothetical protein